MKILGNIKLKMQRSAENTAKIKFGFRGEDITYRLSDKSLEISFTWTTGSKIQSDTIDKWADGSILTTDEKKKIFSDVVRFVARKREKPIVVINVDDPSKNLWEEICAENQSYIESIEYTSHEEQHQFRRNMFLGALKAGGKVLLPDGSEINNEKDLDEYLQNLEKNHDVDQ